MRCPILKFQLDVDPQGVGHLRERGFEKEGRQAVGYVRATEGERKQPSTSFEDLKVGGR